MKSLGLRPLLRAVCSDSGGRWNPGNAKPAAAAACSECRRAAECSWAFRRSSATEDERGSDDPRDELLVEVVPVLQIEWAREVHVGEDVAVEEPLVMGDFAGQHEHRPGKAAVVE